MWYQRYRSVYWRHRTGPAAAGRPDPAVTDAVMSQEQIEKKAEGYLRNSRWGLLARPITTEQLQVEMDRMAQNTGQPEVLQSL